MDRDPRQLILEEALNKFEIGKNQLILVGMRVGKTKLAIEIMKKHNFKSILWVTTNKELRDKGTPEEFKKWGAEELLKVTKFICYNSLHKEKGAYDFMVLDEIQSFSPNNSVGLFTGDLKVETILGLTGTPSKHKDKRELLEKLNFSTLVEMSINDAINTDIISDYQIKLIPLELNSKDKLIESGLKGKKFLQTEFEKYNYLTNAIEYKKRNFLPINKFLYTSRMHLIYNAPTKLFAVLSLLQSLKKEERTLIFCSNTEQAKLLGYPSYNSKTSDKDLKAFQEGKINQLSLVKTGTVGVTYKNIDNVVIIQCDSNNQGYSYQKLSRGLLKREGKKLNVYILYLKDTVDELWTKKFLEDVDTTKIIE